MTTREKRVATHSVIEKIVEMICEQQIMDRPKDAFTEEEKQRLRTFLILGAEFLIGCVEVGTRKGNVRTVKPE